MTEHAHIYRPFDAELRGLKDQLLAMGGLVEAHIAEATRALVERDEAGARRVIEADRAVDLLELAIDEQCVRMLALRQPAASDLRFIAAALKIVTELERIGDLAVNMAERAAILAGEPPLRAVVDLPLMAGAAQRMMKGALDAFVGRDVDQARAVLAADDEVDGMMRRVFTEISAGMEADPTTVRRGLPTIFFAKHLERLADHATNIAELVVYLVRGEDVRHSRG
jgi:phosphate transport system protein